MHPIQGRADPTFPGQKLFCIGLNKTGTASLGKALRLLGLRTHGWDPKVFAHYRRRNDHALWAVIRDWDAFHDWPWPLLIPQLLEWVPSARFVLTRRQSAELWLDSLARHARTAAPNNSPRKFIYGFDHPDENEQAHLEFYEQHYATIQSTFSSRGLNNQLLEVCWEAGDGWMELCNFLQVEVPNVPFPHLNNSGSPK